MTGEPVQRRGVSRRGVLLGAGVGIVAVGAAGVGVATLVTASANPDPTVAPATGATQAGIARPATPQAHGLVAVFRMPGEPTSDRLRDDLAALGRAVLTATGASDATPALTVTIGIGARIVRLIDSALPGADPLPSFRGDDGIAPERVDGDLLIAVHAADEPALRPVLDRVAAAVPDLELAWAEQVSRAAGTGTVTRNLLGYLDGIMVPHGEKELAESVWLASGPAAHGTICVIRRLRLDVAGFGELSLERRDEVIGRHRVDGSPLSGGTRDDPVDLRAKTEAGEYLTPAHSHVRAAHPSFTGSGLMLRRGYAFDAGDDDRGLLFICFQNDLDTFVKTQQRLDEVDALMAFATPTASASFLILPGFTREVALGSSLFA